MHTGHANVALAPRAHRVANGRQRRRQIDDADARAEDVDSFNGHGNSNCAPGRIRNENQNASQSPFLARAKNLSSARVFAQIQG
jgi:hypothetical protein